MEKKQTPTHFAISPEDYAEYQELKAKARIDYDRIKTGSKVRLKEDLSGVLTAKTNRLYDKNKVYTIVLSESRFQVDSEGLYDTKQNERMYTTAVNETSFIHLIGQLYDYITEVIEY